MSIFNNIEKINYHNKKEEVVSLSDYILLEDEEANEKCIIFKFQNNVNQVLREIQFEVSQFDKNGNLVEKSILEHSGFEANANDIFIPNAKIKANPLCKRVKAVTLYALFERIEWSNDEFRNVEYSVDEFRKDFNEKANTEKSKKTKTKKIKSRKEVRLDRRTITIKNVTKANSSALPMVLTIIFSVLLFAFLIATADTFKNQTSKFYDNGFEFTYESEGKVVISNYDNKDSEVVIPKMVKNLEVVGIAPKSFENCSITSVTFTQPIIIGAYAFNNCTKLSEVKGSNLVVEVNDYAFRNCKSLEEALFTTATFVGMGAFSGCSSLKKALLPLATITFDTFSGCNSLNTVEIRGTSNATLKDIFNVTEKDLYALVIDAEELSADFFRNFSFKVLIVKKLDIVLENQFYGMKSCGKMFLTLNNERNELDYSKLAGIVDEFYTDRPLPNGIPDYIQTSIGEYSLDVFYDTYIH